MVVLRGLTWCGLQDWRSVRSWWASGNLQRSEERCIGDQKGWRLTAIVIIGPPSSKIEGGCAICSGLMAIADAVLLGNEECGFEAFFSTGRAQSNESPTGH